jgi:hypothetical protein
MNAAVLLRLRKLRNEDRSFPNFVEKAVVPDGTLEASIKSGCLRLIPIN